ncbi:sulfite exporter TauE/SafE family protein [Ensifer canadensis]
MTLDLVQYILAALSGGLVGFSLGLFGGGGSILAVPLLVQVVGVSNVHVAIGTSAVAVAANALSGLAMHARHGTVKWRCAAMYCVTGIVGAWIGAALGKALDGRRLLLLFAALMAVVSVTMLRRRHMVGDPASSCTPRNAPKVLSFGAGTGIISGFFGIGGGFLIVPGLMVSTGMPTINAIATSLVAITAFGLTTGASYTFSDLVDWPLALSFIGGGALGALTGCRAAHSFSKYQSTLNMLFAVLTFAVAIGLAFYASR